MIVDLLLYTLAEFTPPAALLFYLYRFTGAEAI